MLKKQAALLLGATMIIGTIGAGMATKAQQPEKPENNFYAETAVVVVLDYNDDLVVVEDANGQSWCFEGTEDWEVGDVASLLMNDCGTEIIYDDEIVSAQYSGFQASDIQ